MARAALAVGALAALVLYFVSPPRLRHPGAVSACLPREITLATVAEYHPTGRMVQVKNAKVFDYQEITVEQKLAELGAHVSDGKLLDSQGREIRFFRRYAAGVPAAGGR